MYMNYNMQDLTNAQYLREEELARQNEVKNYSSIGLDLITNNKLTSGFIALALIGAIGYVALKPTTKVENTQVNPVQAVQAVQIAAGNTSNTQIVVPQAQTPVAVANNPNTPLETRLSELEEQAKNTLAFIGKPLGIQYYVDFNGDGHRDELIPYGKAGFIVNRNTGFFKKDENGNVLLDKNLEALGDYTAGSDTYTTERMHHTIKDYFFGTEKYLTQKQVKTAYNTSPGTLCYMLEAAKNYNLWTKGEGGTNNMFKDEYIRIAREIEQDVNKQIKCSNANFAEPTRLN